MLDIKSIRQNPDLLDQSLKARNLPPQSAQILALDHAYRILQTELQTYQQQRNMQAARFAQGRKEGLEIDQLQAQGLEIKEAITLTNEKIQTLETDLQTLLSSLPNIIDVTVPAGNDEAENQEIRRWGTIPVFDFVPKTHEQLGLALQMMDFEKACTVSGSRFVYLRKDLAQLERALAFFMLSLHTQEFAYEEISPPLLVRSNALFGTGQLPKMASDLFKVSGKNQDLWLIPTAEVSVTNFVREQILEEQTLPQRFCAGTPCFRSEAGAAGKDTTGMIRMHHFFKVELVSITTPAQSSQEHERLTQAAETVLQRLQLPYRVMVLCSGDIGFTAQKTYDLEVWLPGQNRYREISSCSNCGDFQARRMGTRYRPQFDKVSKSLPFVHTLNGSGIAVGRALIAVLENYQQPDGSIIIPEVLIPLMNGKKRIDFYDTQNSR